MNIAFFHYSYPGIGGTETVTRLLAEYFTSVGHNVFVVAWHNGENGQVPTDVKDVLVLPEANDFNAESNTDAIVQFINSKDIRVIINQGPFWRIEPAVKACGCKVISVLHYSPTYRIDNNRNAIKRLWQQQTGNPIYFIKTAIRRVFIEYFSMADFKKCDREMLRAMVNDSDAFVVLCEKYVDQLKELLGLRCDNIYAINNPIEIIEDDDYEDYGDRKALIFVGRLTRWDKRVDRLLRIWKMVYRDHPDWKLYIVGDGEERNNLENLAASLKLQNVIFTGYTDPKQYYKKSSILCLTSSSEGFPMVILEAEQYGVVPIAFNASYGIEEVIADSGKTIPPYSLCKYARLLSRLMSGEDTHILRQHIKDNIQKYDKEVIGHKWTALFGQIQNL